MTGEQHILAETDLEPAVKRLIRLSLALVVQPETRRAVMLNLKCKAIAIAILAIPAALASAQSNSSVFCTNNPDDAGYRGPVDCAGAYQGKAAAAPSAPSASRFRVVTNPDDSGYRGPVASASEWSEQVQQGFFGAPVQSRPDSTIKIRSASGMIYVDHLKTAKIENDKGQSFTWQFDGLMSMTHFPLKLIAPEGFDAGNMQVHILHPSHHTDL